MVPVTFQVQQPGRSWRMILRGSEFKWGSLLQSPRGLIILLCHYVPLKIAWFYYSEYECFNIYKLTMIEDTIIVPVGPHIYMTNNAVYFLLLKVILQSCFILSMISMKEVRNTDAGKSPENTHQMWGENRIRSQILFNPNILVWGHHFLYHLQKPSSYLCLLNLWILNQKG